MIPRLGVNIDHVATLRQARGEDYPSLVNAAKVCLENGADQITIHLREDRRHIQDTDVGAIRLITKKFGKPLNFEMGSDPEIVEIAIATKPDWVCIVPEKREERTTEGGLNLCHDETFQRVKQAIEKIRDTNDMIKVSLFLEHDLQVLKKAKELNAQAVEIHTGDYARDFLHGNEYDHHLSSFQSAKDFLLQNNIAVHAGHGLTDQSVIPLLEKQLFEEYNIGHWMICQSLFEGLANVTSNLKDQFTKLEIK